MNPALPENIRAKINRKGGVKTIVVAGAHSGIGKTKFAESLLRRLSGFSALKVTVVKAGGCPRKSPCGVCQKQKTPFTIISNPRIINHKGKDTQRLKAAGAKKVLWLKARPEGLKGGLKRALEKLSGAKGVIIEGTSVLKYLKPDLSFFIDCQK